MAPGRMVTSSRRAGRVTNKTKLLILKGNERADLASAEIIVWENETSSSSEGTKHQHVGAKGVESGELLEHHLQAALSSASLLLSRSTPNPSSPSSSKPQTSHSTLNYHIPTPDATGLIQVTDYAELYQKRQYVEPTGYIRFSDTVEESSGGWGGLGYCMDDEDERWLTTFNAKAEGSSGGDQPPPSPSPLRDSQGVNQPAGMGRPSRMKGKGREEKDAPAALYISEDTFEYIMGVLEKHAEDSVPMLHTNLSLMPTFASVEPLFSSPIQASFLPSNEVPKNLPELKTLARMARSVFSHWKDRRERRKGKSIMPALNYDETNDGDPYVCFRRRDIRATRKTRRTDNFSVERMQKLQYELRSAHSLAQMVLKREQEKHRLYGVEREVWEAKWKLWETKKRWPSLGMSSHEELLITGRELAVLPSATVNISQLGGHHALTTQQQNVPQIRKRMQEREKEDRERRAMDGANKNADRNPFAAISSRHTPEAVTERMLALKQKLDEEIARKKEVDQQWDDVADNSYLPLPPASSQHGWRPVSDLDPFRRRAVADSVEDDQARPSAFRLRRGRDGILRLDRRPWVPARLKLGSKPSLEDRLFPDTLCLRPASRRPRSIDDIPQRKDDDEEEEDEDEDEDDGDEAAERVQDDGDDTFSSTKRRRLNEIWRYDADHGGAVGVGMGLAGDEDRVIIDDLDPKYMRYRISLLDDNDCEKLRPELTPFAQAMAQLDTVIELPPPPIFNRPAPPNQAVLQQQALQHQHQVMQMEQFQRFQQQLAQQQAAMAQQQALLAQQQQLAAQQSQQQMPLPVNGRVQSTDGVSNGSPAVNGTAMLPPGAQVPNGRPVGMKRPPSQNGQMPPPSQQRPSLSPTASLHPGQSPQMANGIVQPNPVGFQPGQTLTPQQQAQLRMHLQAQAQAQAQLVAAAHANNDANGSPAPVVNGHHAATAAALANFTPEQMRDIATQAQAHGFGNDIGKYIAHARMQKVKQLKAASEYAQQQQQQQQQANMQAVPGSNGNGIAQTQSFASPVMASNPGMQLKLPAHRQAQVASRAQ
ncbi:enhancer of polycomb-like-domain-containing protein [Naematelia encephala]|uniref:Enhancer of polycomb-like protein n=1 Tax=Naematelia encephala TaxID=71784 RepID=A0A1Y2B6Y9_9TREE|nr:enhancer of polycomb-like-domain-containing protein [Naematelia encephala]